MFNQNDPRIVTRIQAFFSCSVVNILWRVWREFDSPSPGKSNSVFTINPNEAQLTDIHLFPYPSHRLTIYSISGAILKTVEFYGLKLTIKISNLPPGIYIVEIEEETMQKLKLIVQ
jgi:hypothetical protein